MIKFRKKNFSIEEGEYTGPKDMEKVPSAAEVIGKGTLGGTILGGIIGKLGDTEVIESALTGGKFGFLGGILLKILINYLHNPMTKVKYQEVDKNIRRQFGVYRMSGVTVGDSIDKRASIDEKFSFNDRNVTDYKISFAIADNKITMYTFGIDQEELKKLDKILDYYCKKYYGMQYTSELINQKMLSYSVNIVFTNYQVISNFIMEISDSLETKINLLDNKALISGRLSDVTKDDVEKRFSVSPINKFDLVKIIGKGGTVGLLNLITVPITKSIGGSIAYVAMSILSAAMDKINNDDLVRQGVPMPREFFNNTALESSLKKLYYIEGFNYTVNDKKAPANISMMNGRFMVTVPKDTDDCKEIDEKYYNSAKGLITRADLGKVIVYTYTIKSRQEFEFLLKKLMSTKITFNIFEG